MDTGRLVAAAVAVAEAVTVAAAAAEIISAAAAEQDNDYEDNPKTVVIAEKHVEIPPFIWFQSIL